MSSIQWAAGHNNAAGLLNVGPFQPRCPGLKYPARVMAVDGTMVLKGLRYTEVIWDFQRDADYAATLTQMGLSESAPSVEGTIKLPLNDRATWANFNCTALWPEPEFGVDFDRGFALRLTIRIIGLEAL